MRILLLNEIKKEMPNSRALDALNTAMGRGGGNKDNGKIDFNSPEMKTIINDDKMQILKYAGLNEWNNNSKREQIRDARAMVDIVAEKGSGFGLEVAKTVQKYGYRVSEKQAYVISKTLQEWKAKL